MTKTILNYTTYLTIMEEIGWPNIFLVPPAHYEHVDGDSAHGLYGIASDFEPIIALNKKTPEGKPLLGRVLKNSIYHELLHHLFPSWPHWKIYLGGYVMARGGGDWMRKEYYGHTVDELPPRDKLLHKIRLAVKRYNKKRMNGKK